MQQKYEISAKLSKTLVMRSECEQTLLLAICITVKRDYWFIISLPHERELPRTGAQRGHGRSERSVVGAFPLLCRARAGARRPTEGVLSQRADEEPESVYEGRRGRLRGRGVAAAVLQAALLEAKHRPDALAVLQPGDDRRGHAAAAQRTAAAPGPPRAAAERALRWERRPVVRIVRADLPGRGDV